MRLRVHIARQKAIQAYETTQPEETLKDKQGLFSSPLRAVRPIVLSTPPTSFYFLEVSYHNPVSSQ